MLNKVYNSENETWETVEKQKVRQYGESVTDKSFFRPNVSNFNDLIGATQTEIDKSQYDFPDGKDNGMRFYNITSKSLDRAEREQNAKEIMRAGQEAKEEMSQLESDLMQEMAERQAEMLGKQNAQESTKTTE